MRRTAPCFPHIEHYTYVEEGLMTHSNSVAFLLALMLTLVWGSTAEVAAQSEFNFGPQIVLAEDWELGIGGRVIADIEAFSSDEDSFFKDLRGIAEFIWYLDPEPGGIGFFDGGSCDDADCTAWELNANGAIPFTLGESATDFYAGAGLNLASFSAEFLGTGFDETEVGLNLLGGFNFDLGTLDAFAEVNVRLSGSEQFVILGGVAVGGGGD